MRGGSEMNGGKGHLKKPLTHQMMDLEKVFIIGDSKMYSSIWLEHRTCNPKVVGSNPTTDKKTIKQQTTYIQANSQQHQQHRFTSLLHTDSQNTTNLPTTNSLFN